MSSAGDYIVRGGECGDRIRNINWAKTELGPIGSWSAELLSTVNTMLNMPLAIVLLVGEGGCLLYNDAYARFAGPKHPEILGQPHAQAWPEIAQYNNDMCDRIYAGEAVAYNEQLLQLKRGKKFEDVYLDLNYSPVFSAAGDTIAMQVSVIDVTSVVVARNAAAAALTLAESQQQMAEDAQGLAEKAQEMAEDAARITQAITDNATTAIFILDKELYCTFMNPAAVKMTGYTLAQLKKTGKTLHEAIHGNYPDGSVYPLQDCPITDSMRRLQLTAGDEAFVRKNGSYFPVYFVASPIVIGGQLDSVIMEVRDMTETEQLKELNRAKDDFIALASHQLRTPATSVKQYLGILMQEYAGPLNDQQLQYLQTTYNANERELTIIEDLLKTARVDIKGFKLNLRTASVNKLVRDAASAAAAMLDTKNQKLEVRLPEQDVITRFDKVELGICIDNLLENASKYSSGGAAVTISVKEDEKFVDIAVKDNGVGIAPGDHQAIFEKFTRVDNVLSDTVSGNGLGLYWVKRIVDLHKGKVIIKSELGKGSTFIIRLPQ